VVQQLQQVQEDRTLFPQQEHRNSIIQIRINRKEKRHTNIVEASSDGPVLSTVTETKQTFQDLH
jgi:hypothetical protein